MAHKRCEKCWQLYPTLKMQKLNDHRDALVNEKTHLL